MFNDLFYSHTLLFVVIGLTHTLYLYMYMCFSVQENALIGHKKYVCLLMRTVLDQFLFILF